MNEEERDEMYLNLGEREMIQGGLWLVTRKGVLVNNKVPQVFLCSLFYFRPAITPILFVVRPWLDSVCEQSQGSGCTSVVGILGHSPLHDDICTGI